ncbi:MAG: S-layer homology domain-containing protein, partial [Clostridia bacterium]|nr:S-layer homology domain-containing protein [Clostridia bacterium]
EGDYVVLDIITTPVYESKDASASVKLVGGVFELYGDDKDNYELADFDVTGAIDRRPLTVKAHDVEIYEGARIPSEEELTYTIVEGSLVSGETLQNVLVYRGPVDSIAGTEAQIVRNGHYQSANPNYEITVIPGTFSVSEKEAQSITVGTLANATYGDTGIKLAINDTQVGLGDYTVTSTNEDVATIAHDGTVTIVGAGSTTFKVTRAGNDTYKDLNENVPFVVNKRTLPVALATTTIQYGEACSELVYINFANGDDASDLDVEPTINGIPSLLNAGTYPFTISGGRDNNYEYSYANGSLIVNKLRLTVSVNPAVITYGETFVPEFTYIGFLSGEDETSALTRLPQVSGVTSTDAGEYEITATGAVAQNYDIFYAGVDHLVIEKAPLTIGVNGALITYGDQFVPEFTFDGFVNGENKSVLTTQPSVSGAGTDVGFYQISATGASAANYEITYADPARLTISKKAVTVTASTPANVRIGSSAPALTYTVSPALVAGDSFEGALALAEPIPSELPGGTLYKDIEILQGTLALNDNYELTYVPATLRVVEKDPQVVTFNNTLTATYGDAGVKLLINDQNSALGGFTIASSNQEVATVDNLGNITVLGAGETTLTVSRAGNADIADFTGEAVLTVNKANLTISIPSETITYGTLYSPAEKVSYTGFVNGETKEVLLTPVTVGTGIDFNSVLGADTYALTLSGATAENYNISYGENNATLTVAKAPLTIGVNGATITYGETFVPEFTFSGFVNGEDKTVLSVQPTVSGATSTNAGTYQISASGAEASNYNITYALASTLTISKKSLTVSANSEQMGYGDLVPAFTINYDGFITGETEANLLTPAVAGTFERYTDVGEHTIVLSGATSDNYEISYTTTGKLTVTARPLSITALGVFDKEYDENTTATINPSTLVFNGVVNNDDVTINLENAVATFATADAGENIVVTITNLALAGTKKDNYTLGSTEFATTGTILPELTASDVAANISTQITLTKDATELPEIVVPEGFTATFDLSGVAEGSVITSEGKVLPTETEQAVSLPLTVTKTGRDQTATITVAITVPASTQYVITATSQDSSKVTVTGGNTYLKNQTATIVATVIDTNYIFSGWYNGTTLVSNSATYTFTVTENLDLVAKYTSSVISGGDFGGTSTPTDSSVSIPVNGSDAGISATVSGTSVVITKIDTTKVDTENTKELNIDLSDVKGAIDTVKLPTASVKNLKDAGVEGITVTFKSATMSFDAKALEAVEGAGGTRVTISAKELKTSSLASVQQKAIKDLAGAKVYKFQIAGNKTVSDFNGGKVAVTIRYTLAEGCNNIKANFVAKDGSLEEIEANYSNGFAVLYPKHFSEYVISSVKEEVYENPFTDVKEDDWFFESVKQSYESGLMKGMTDTEFAPALSVTRAMFVTVLHRLAGEPVVNFALSFDDVKQDEWYTEAIRWAASEKIVLGITDTEFGVNSEITREQMVTLLYRYAQSKGLDVSYSDDVTHVNFNDFGGIHSYAIHAVNWATDKGVMQGNADNTFAPRKSATRAETAAVFTRFVNLIK